jgi:type II secretory pathway pseudopilin PulG
MLLTILIVVVIIGIVAWVAATTPPKNWSEQQINRRDRWSQ